MRCRVGDLAVIVSCLIDANIGKLVRVTRAASHPLFDWRVVSEGSLLLGYESADRMRVGQADTMAMMDYELRPIRPDADPVSTDTTREVTA